jgi:predicted DCC family thiol-disulfide oxidoreductase YuxK
MPNSLNLRVYYDGACPFCQGIKSRVARFDTRHRVDFMDYHHPATASEAPFPEAALAAEMHACGSDGRWHIGYFAWAAILRELPAWKWLGWLMIMPPFRWFGPAIYRWIARRRYSLFGLPVPCDEHACTLPQTARHNPATPTSIASHKS